MYDISYFKASDQKDVIAFMHAHPFVILCGVDVEGKPVATHVPVLLEKRGDKLYLLAHVMRKQEHTVAFEHNQHVLAIFSGASSYVSASWYDNKQVASTINYQAVHAKGILKFVDDEQLHNILTRLTEKFEHNPHSPALVQHMDDAYVHKLMAAIIAFEIEIQSVEHVFKLSQNHKEVNYDSIASHLAEQNSDAKELAEAMAKNKENVFNK